MKIRMAKVTIPAHNPTNIPATILLNKNQHPIPKISPAGINNASLFSFVDLIVFAVILTCVVFFAVFTVLFFIAYIRYKIPINLSHRNFYSATLDKNDVKLLVEVSASYFIHLILPCKIFSCYFIGMIF